MICAYLLYNRTYFKAEEALAYFGERRTDLKVGRAFQGVQTPSQVCKALTAFVNDDTSLMKCHLQARYVGYVEDILSRLGGQLPAARTMQLKAVKVRALEGLFVMGIDGLIVGCARDVKC